jgi:hypothetical protein
MEPHPIHRLALKPNEETLELVDPGEGTLIHKALFVDRLVKMALPTTLGALPIALVFRNIRSHASIPKQFPCLFCVKCTISIKECTAIVKSKLVQLAKDVFEAMNELVTIVVITSNNLACGKNEAVCIG